MWFERKISNKIKKLSTTRPAVLVTGARQVGKSSLLKRLFSKAQYITLDKVVKAQEAEQNPESFLTSLTPPALLDEVQYAPSLFRELKIFIDRERDSYGHWILTGSQKFQLMKNVSESLAGRVGIVTMETLSTTEIRPYSDRVNIMDLPWKGGYPELWAHKDIEFSQFFEDYVQTYLERDLKAMMNVSNLRDFQRFMKAVAIRVGQLLNYADIAKDVGVSQVTVKKWISVLEAGGLIILLAPFYRNMGKRLIKAPKIYFADNGLLCHLLDIEDDADYKRHIYRGQIWENFTFTELFKTYDLIPNKHIFFYRDQNGVEIDFILEKKSTISLLEVKDSEKVDNRKLNFSKVAVLFKDQPACYVASAINDTKAIQLKDYSMYNPLLCQDSDLFSI